MREAPEQKRLSNARYRQRVKTGDVRPISKTAEYKAWEKMISRCYNPKDISYENYGARGIKVCDRWRRSFLAFLADVGFKPTPKHSLGRKKNHLNYTPNNVEWETAEQQQNNRRNNVPVLFRGVRLTHTQSARAVGMSPSTLTSRLGNGWSMERALATPVRTKRKH